MPVTFLPDLKHAGNFTIDVMKQTSIRFNENPTSGFWVVACGRTDRLNEANGRFSQLYEQVNQRIEFLAVSIVTAKHREKGKNIFVWAKQFCKSGRTVYWTACVLVGSSAVISLSFFWRGFQYLEAGFIVLNIYVHLDAIHMWLS